MSRIQPYCDDKAQTAIGQFNDAWSRRLAAYEKEEEMKAKKSSSLCGIDGVIDVDAPSSKKRGSSHISSDAETRQRKRLAVEEDKRQGETLQRLPTVDESIRPYSAWLLHNDIHQRLLAAILIPLGLCIHFPHLRVLAAARYVNTFQKREMLLRQDPMIMSAARPEALEILYQGGTDNVFAAHAFENALEKQKEWEKETGYSD